MKTSKKVLWKQEAAILFVSIAMASFMGCWGQAFLQAPVETIETSSKIDSLLKENAVLRERVVLVEEALRRAEERDRSTAAALRVDLDELKDQLNAVTEMLREIQDREAYKGADRKRSPSVTSQKAISEPQAAIEESSIDSLVPAESEQIDSTGGVKPGDSGASGTAQVPYPEELHRRIYLAYSRREYENAIDESRVFLSEYPDNPLAQEVIYLRAQSLSELGRQADALKEYSTLLQRFPGGKRVPGALLRMAITYESMGQVELAAGVVRRLIAEYPKSSEAKAAEERFSSIIDR